MSLVLPVFFHWSPASKRASIKRHGLRPTTPTYSPIGPPLPGGARECDPDDGTVYAVCLGTSPSHAWSLSGAIFGERGQEWDLWQVVLDPGTDDHPGDEVHPLPFFGNRLDEVRVANAITKDRLWLVGTREIGYRRW